MMCYDCFIKILMAMEYIIIIQKNSKILHMLQLDPLNKYKNRKHYKPPPAQDSSTNYKKLVIVIVISFIFITGQFVGGYISHSISVISDAFHLVTDLLGFVVSFIFLCFAKRKPNQKMSFAYHRMELIGALANLFIIWFLAIFFIYQATQRIINKQFVKSPLVMLIVAAAGLPINIIMYFVLHAGGSHSHGLMAQPCGEQYPVEQHNQSDNMCSQMICEDIDCLISNQYEEHCHKKQGPNQSIHKHQIKVVVEGGQVKRKSSIDEGKSKHDHKNCTHDHGHDHEKKPDNSEEHIHNHKHDHKHEHKHEHKPGQKCSHNHNADNKQSKNMIKRQDSHKHSHSHAGHDHAGHNHAGHDHAGHDHSGDDHSGHGHSHQSLSMKAAILHALSDVIQSIGLLISSLIIFFAGSDMGKEVTEWNDVHYCDPIATYIFSTIVFISTYPVLKNCYYIIMESTPDHIKPEEIREEFSKAEGVIDIHDLHIWDLRPGKTILIAHVFSKKGQETQVLKRLTDIARRKRIYHSTFQVEEEELKDNEEYILCDHDIH